MTTAHRMTVLVVDDDTSLRIAVARALRVAGYDVVVAAEGTEALETQRASPSDANANPGLSSNNTQAGVRVR
jgi:CheY-like chemotaxis protein